MVAMKGMTLAVFLLLPLLRANGRLFSFGRINGGYLDLPAKGAQSVTDCLKKQCGSFPNCSVAYIEEIKGRCFRMRLSSQILLWNLGALVEDYSWQIYMNFPKQQVKKRPVVLWLFDKVTGGKNYGTRGSKMDISTANLTFQRPGPKGSSTITYADIRARSRRSSVSLLDRRVSPLVFKKPFTMAMWVMTLTGVPEGKPYTLISGTTKRLWEFNHAQNQLTLCVQNKVCASTEENSKNLHKWRHVAVVFRSLDDVIFYLDGNKWPVMKKMPFSRNSNTNQDVLHMFDSFAGSMACVAIFENSLTSSEIQIVQNNCP